MSHLSWKSPLAISTVTTSTFICTLLTLLKTITIILQTTALRTLATHLISQLLTIRTLVPRRSGVVAVGAGTFNATDLSMRKTLAVPGLAFRFWTFTFEDSSPKISGLYFEQIIDPVLDFVDACLLTVIELRSSST